MTLLPLQVREFPEHLQEDFDWILSQSLRGGCQISDLAE